MEKSEGSPGEVRSALRTSLPRAAPHEHTRSSAQPEKRLPTSLHPFSSEKRQLQPRENDTVNRNRGSRGKITDLERVALWLSDDSTVPPHPASAWLLQKGH